MMDLLGTMAVLLVVVLLVYGLGYAFSLGYHRGKREFVNRMIKENCKGK